MKPKYWLFKACNEWYFWDKDWQSHGPFKNEAEATVAADVSDFAAK